MKLIEGEEFTEIKILVSHKSYKEYFKKRKLVIDPTHLFNLFSEELDIRKLEVHGAVVCKSSPQLYVQVSGNGSIIKKRCEEWN